MHVIQTQYFHLCVCRDVLRNIHLNLHVNIIFGNLHLGRELFNGFVLFDVLFVQRYRTAKLLQFPVFVHRRCRPVRFSRTFFYRRYVTDNLAFFRRSRNHVIPFRADGNVIFIHNSRQFIRRCRFIHVNFLLVYRNGVTRRTCHRCPRNRRPRH